MPTYHSEVKEVGSFEKICGTVILPIKTQVRGPAPPAKSDASDIIDETLNFFRANVLFRNYKYEGPADLTLCYLTVYIAECLRLFSKYKTKNEAQKNIVPLAVSGNFAIPGEKGFPLPGFFSPPQSKTEDDNFRAYFRQLREETANRLILKAFKEDGSQNKWWISFSKRKFMNVEHT